MKCKVSKILRLDHIKVHALINTTDLNVFAVSKWF